MFKVLAKAKRWDGYETVPCEIQGTRIRKKKKQYLLVATNQTWRINSKGTHYYPKGWYDESQVKFIYRFDSSITQSWIFKLARWIKKNLQTKTKEGDGRTL